MDISGFISQRILRNDDKSRISRPIVRIATIGIAVGVAMMLLSLAIVNGFQQEIRNKVIGFGSHFQVTSNERNFSRDSQKLLFDPEVYGTLKNTEGVRHVQVFATKPGIIETPEALQGVIIKGVGSDFDWTFLNQAIKEGSIIRHASAGEMNIVLSTYLANRLKLKLNDKVSLYFFNEDADPRQRNFTVTGIYETGLEDFDQQFVFVDIGHVQRLAGWGLRVEAQTDSVFNYLGGILVGAQAFGGEGMYDYKWTDSTWHGEGPHVLWPVSDTTIRVIATDEGGTVPDTSWITLDFKDAVVDPLTSTWTTTITSTESDTSYIGGYEVLINDYEQLLEADDKLFGSLTTKFLQTQKITDRNPEIFSWLEMLDINVIIIIVLMIVISVVNMTSALLIIILERQNMIGTLKALGIQDRPVIVIFMLNAGAIIGRGMIWGNIVGIGLALLQWKFGIISLDPTNYYLDKVPVKLDFMYMLLLDLGTLLVCVLFMIIPALYVTKISPIKAIRFS